VMPIAWQRLVNASETCPRCRSTQDEMERAVATLTEVLRPLHIEPTLETVTLDQATFDEAPTVCGEKSCRTVAIDGTVYEAVPEELIVKAGLAAASTLVTACRSTAAADPR
jgi:hypothetical protein